MKKTIFSFLLSATLSCSCVTYAQEKNEPIITKTNYTSELAKANNGDIESTYNVGIMMLTGYAGAPKNPEKAILWIEKAATQGHINAQGALGKFYLSGQYVKRSPEQAFQWYMKAAEKGNSIAQKNIGLLYILGIGINKDPQKALNWFEKAAIQGDAEAQLSLAQLLQEGRGVPLDKKQAFMWCMKAAIQNNTKAQHTLGNMYITGCGTEPNMVEAFKWITISATNLADAEKKIANRNLELLKASMDDIQIGTATEKAHEWIRDKTSTPKNTTPDPIVP